MSAADKQSLTSGRSRAFPMIRAFVLAYPGRSATALGAVFLAGLMDGLGLSMLLSMLSFAIRTDKHEPSMPEQFALRVAEFVGLHITQIKRYEADVLSKR